MRITTEPHLLAHWRSQQHENLDVLAQVGRHQYASTGFSISGAREQVEHWRVLMVVPNARLGESHSTVSLLIWVECLLARRKEASASLSVAI